MKFNIVGECDHDSGLPDVLYWLSPPDQWEAFAKDYGDGLDLIGVDLICSKLLDGLKPRIRHAKKEKALYMDIMLTFDEFASATAEERKKIAGQRLLDDVPRIVRKYKFANFDTELFLSDFKKYYSDLLEELPHAPALTA